MKFPSKKKKHSLKRVTPKPGNKNQPQPYKPPVKYDPGIVMNYLKPLLDRYGKQNKEVDHAHDTIPRTNPRSRKIP
jgi:hypothetical protein